MADDVDASHFVDALAGAIIYRRLMTHEPIDDACVEDHVDRLLRLGSRPALSGRAAI